MASEKFRPSKKGRRGEALIVFGLSEDGRPRAGTFQTAEAGPAMKAAEAMGLSVVKVANRASRSVAANLPAGRIHSTGRGFVPFVSAALFEPLQRLTGLHLGDPKSEKPAAKTSSKEAGDKPRLPTSWDDIAPGDLVLAQDDDPKDGWWEAIVLRKTGETFSIKWRQGTQRKTVPRHKYNLALVWPGTDLAADKATVNAPTAAYPDSWQAINTDHVVLAKEDGPMEQWWEANPVAFEADAVTLRWRDYPTLQTIARSRLALALIYPNPMAKSAGKAAAV